MKGASRKKLKYNVEEETWGVEQPAPNKPPPPPCLGDEEDGLVSGKPPTSPPPNLGSNRSAEKPEGAKPANLTQGAAPESSKEAGAIPGSKQAEAQWIQKTILDYTGQEPPEPVGSESAASNQPASKEENNCFVGSTIVKEGAIEGAGYEEVKTRKEKIPQTPKNTMKEGQNMKNTMLLATPSMGNTINCSINRKGFCNTHREQTEKTLISTKKWRDRGGGRGFGYVTVKSTKYYCKSGVIAKKSIDIDQESRNLDMPASVSNNLTGLVRDLDVGAPEIESSSRGQVD